MKEDTYTGYYKDAVALLKQLIACPSYSKEEAATADIIAGYLSEQGVKTERHLNNVWAQNLHYDAQKPSILLHGHHDTVKPNKGYTHDPFLAFEEEGKLYGLGSNDAGGCLVALVHVFLHFYTRTDLAYNLIFVAAAAEEISGKEGIESVLPQMPPISFAIVGEPTEMELAVAEKGLMVLDVCVLGSAGHAARGEGDNAIYKAMKVIDWLQQYQFSRSSPLLGPVHMNVTMIQAGSQHNVVPDQCSLVVDVRINELYTHEEVLATIEGHIGAQVSARSTRLRSSSIPVAHPLVQAGIQLGRKTFGSHTLSDKALMPFPALKMGPGLSARSHTANEFIYLHEIQEGIDTYIQLLNAIL